jgi:sentrin-specific protease 8
MSDRNKKTALNFHDSCLKLSDVDLLKGPHWLNDQIISFYFEYLEKVRNSIIYKILPATEIRLLLGNF